MVNYRKKNNDILIGKDVKSKNKVFLKEKDRLNNTLLIGDVGTNKIVQSLKPMLINDIKSRSCSAIFITNNKDVVIELKEQFNEDKLTVIDIGLNTKVDTSAIDWNFIEHIINKEKSLIINYGYGELDEDEKDIIRLIIDKIKAILINRVNKDKPIYFYIDEFNDFISDNLIEFIKTNKLLNIGLILSTKSRLLIDEYYVHNIDEHIKNLIVYPGLNYKEAKYFSKIFNDLNKGNSNIEDFTVGSLIYKPLGQFTVCLMNDDSRNHPQIIKYLNNK